MTLAVDDAVRDELADAPPAAVAVWLVIQEADAPVSARDIVEATTLSRSAVGESLSRLRDRALICQHENYRGDARKPLYEAVISVR